MPVVRRGMQEICERYRPRRLSEICGNQNVVKSLSVMLSKPEEERQHCYLFAGNMGSGKTTIARVLALSLNCENGDSGEPCLECESCLNGLKDNCFFINEVNCSKFTTKEEAFKLSEQFLDFPMMGRNNIFILDEAHKLSDGAQNLLLKSLENPPPHTYFFICTTEPEKIIPTIHDRSSEFLLKAPDKEARKELLIDVFRQEGWGDKLSKEDKITLISSIRGFSYRKILKTIEQVVNGGIGVLNDILDMPSVNDQCKEFDIVRMIFDKCIYRPFLPEYKNISYKDLYNECLNMIAEMDNFSSESFRRVFLSLASSRILKKVRYGTNDAELEKFKLIIPILEKPYYDSDGSIARFLIDLNNICFYLKEK